MKKWIIEAGCKVNLFLEITGIRENGYHELDSIFYPLAKPFDTISIVQTAAGGMHFSCSAQSLNASDNIMVKTYDAYASATGFAPHVSVHLEKRIPTGAGLGGGSSDAAALLLWLNSQAGAAAMVREQLNTLAATLGADVPFFLANVPARVRGIGEIVEPIEFDLSEYAMLLVCPEVHVNTAWAYRRWDEVNAGTAVGRKSLTVKKCEFKKPSFTKPPVFWNCFEDVVFQEFPALYEIKQVILHHGALACVMSGSGSSLCAVFESIEGLARCAKRLGSSGLICHEINPGGTGCSAVSG